MESIDMKLWIEFEQLSKTHPLFCRDSRNARELIRQKKLDPEQWRWGRIIADKWVQSTGSSRKFDRILFNRQFVETIDDTKTSDGVAIAPPIIKLEDHERFRDDQGHTLDIQTRGERKFDYIFFLVVDIEKGFEIPRLTDVLTNKQKSGYVENVHFKYFNCPHSTKDGNNIFKKCLFLTYLGMLRTLFVSKSHRVNCFVKWATETLFTSQMGTRRARKNLAAGIMGVDADVIREVFDKGAHTLPCIYLFTLGTVKDLRQSMLIDTRIDDSAIVAKFGFTKDLARRTKEHTDTLGSIPNAELRLKLYSFIDPQFMSAAEREIKLFMNAFHYNLPYKKTEVLVTIPKPIMKIIEGYYECLGRKYMGHLAEYVIRLQDVEHKYLMCQKDNLMITQLNQKDHLIELQQKNLEIKELECQNEILRMRIQLLEQRTK